MANFGVNHAGSENGLALSNFKCLVRPLCTFAHHVACSDVMDECAAIVKAAGDAEAKTYKKYFEWRENMAIEEQFEIEIARANQEKSEVKSAELPSDISGPNIKIDELVNVVATYDQELVGATAVQNKEAADFIASEARLFGDTQVLAATHSFVTGQACYSNRGRFHGICQGTRCTNVAPFHEM